MEKFEYKVVTYDTKGFWVETSKFTKLKISLTCLGVKDGKWLAVHPPTKVMVHPKA